MPNENRMPWERVTAQPDTSQQGMPWERATQKPMQPQIQPEKEKKSDFFQDVMKYPAKWVGEWYKGAGDISDTFSQWSGKLAEWGGNLGVDVSGIHVGEKPEEGKGKVLFELGPYLQVMQWTADQYKGASAFATIKETADKLGENLLGAVDDAGGIDPWTNAILSGTAKAAVDIPAIMAMGLPVFSGLSGGAEAIKYGESVMQGVVEGGIKGAALHTILKGLNTLPKIERMAAMGGTFGGALPAAEEGLAEMMGREPHERDWPQVVADYVIGAGLAWAGPKGAEYRRSFYQETFKYLTKGPERVQIERAKRFVDVMERKMAKDANKDKTPSQVIKEMEAEGIGENLGINMEAVRDKIASLAVKQGIKEGMDAELVGKPVKPTEQNIIDVYNKQGGVKIKTEKGKDENTLIITKSVKGKNKDKPRLTILVNKEPGFHLTFDNINKLSEFVFSKSRKESFPDIQEYLIDSYETFVKKPTEIIDKSYKKPYEPTGLDIFGPKGVGSVILDGDIKLLKSWAIEAGDANVTKAIEWLKAKAAEDAQIETGSKRIREKIVEAKAEGEYELFRYGEAAKQLEVFLKEKELSELKASKPDRIKSDEEKKVEPTKDIESETNPEKLRATVEEIPPLDYSDPLSGETFKIHPKLLSTIDWIAQNEKRLSRYQRYAEKVEKIFEGVDAFHNTFSIEHQFKEAEEIGNIVKRGPSIGKMYEDWGLAKFKEVAKNLKYKDEDLDYNFVYALEDKTSPLWQDKVMAPELTRVDKWFKDMYREYESRGGLEMTWNERMIKTLKEELNDPKLSKESRATVNKTIKRVKETNFEHIPSRIWFERGIQHKEAANRFEHMRNLLSLRGVRERKSIRLKDLVTKKIIARENLHLRDVIGDYARRIGKDVALLDVLNKGKEIGWVTEKPRSVRLKSGKKVDYLSAPFHTPIFRGKYIHPVLKKWAYEMAGDPSGSNMFSRGVQNSMSGIKMAQFYNPLFLPMYDLVQLGMLDPGAVKFLRQANKDYNEQNATWREAEYWGVRSQPYANLMDSYQKQLLRAGKRIDKRILDAHNLLPTRMVSNMYNASWNTAWKYDGIIRQASYRQLRSKGFSPKEAGKLAAKFHGDYANVPAKTRKFLNHVFFTPTFKVAMMKLHKDMVKGVIQLGEGDKTSRNLARKQALGLAKAAGMMITWDLIMTQGLGFDREDFGWKYKKQITGEKGKEDFIIGFSGPHNMWVNEFHRLKRAVSPVNDNALKAWYRGQVNKRHPFYSIVSDLIENRDRGAEPEMFYTGEPVPIYKKFDDPYNKWLDRTEYFIKNAFPILKAPGTVANYFGKDLDVPLISADAREKKIHERTTKETSKLFEALTRPFTFRYTTVPKWKRAQQEIKGLEKDILAQIGAFGTEGWNKNNDVAIQSLRERIKDLRKVINDDLDRDDLKVQW